MITRSIPRAVHTEVIDDVPSELVDKVAQDFRDSSAMEVKLERNPDGATWRVIAIFEGS